MDHKKDQEKHFTVFSIDTLGTKKPEQFLYLEEKHIYFFVRIPSGSNMSQYLCSKISMPETGGLAMKLFITDKVTHGRSWFFGQEMTTRRDTFWIEQKDLYLELSKDLFKYERITSMVNEFLSSLLKKSGIRISGKFVSFTKPFRDFISRNNLLQIIDIINKQPYAYLEEKSFNKVSHLIKKPLRGLNVIGKITLPEKKRKVAQQPVGKTPMTRIEISKEITKYIKNTRKGSTVAIMSELSKKKNFLTDLLFDKVLFISFQNGLNHKYSPPIEKFSITITNITGQTITGTSFMAGFEKKHKSELYIKIIDVLIKQINKKTRIK